MGEPHVITALRAKRAEMAGEIRELERRARYYRGKLAHLDETIRLFDADLDPSTIPARRPHRKGGYFNAGELSRFVQEYLRDHPEPVPASEIALAAMRKKELPMDARHLIGGIKGMVTVVLRSMAKRGAAMKVGDGIATRWAVTPD